MPDSIAKEIRVKWKPRKKKSHKGDYGRVFILAGSKEYSGAAYLAGLSCLRSGAGLVTLGVPDQIHTLVARRQPELIVKSLDSTSQGSLSLKNLAALLPFIQTQNVLAMGPGLSRNAETQELVRALLKKTRLPLILDADALNALQGKSDLLLKAEGRTIVTPHPAEFCRLFGGTLKDADSERKKKALAAAAEFRCIVILKGFHTVAANPAGDCYVNRNGNPGMATAGTGDVLTGMIAALIAQKFPLWDSARFAVYLHGLAGDLAARKKGSVSLIAGDLIDFISQALRQTLSKCVYLED